MSFNRHTFALEVANRPNEFSLSDIACGLYAACAAAKNEELNPEEDAAVLVLGAFVAFHTHADVNSTLGFQRLLAICQANGPQPTHPEAQC